MEKNTVRITIGNWTFDAFITENGNLGLTIDEPNKPEDGGSCKSIDVFVNDKLNIVTDAERDIDLQDEIEYESERQYHEVIRT